MNNTATQTTHMPKIGDNKSKLGFSISDRGIEVWETETMEVVATCQESNKGAGYAKLFAASKELLEALTGNEEDPHLYAVNWLATLLRICEKEKVYNEIVKDQGTDYDSVNIMIAELKALVNNGNAAIKKAAE